MEKIHSLILGPGAGLSDCNFPVSGFDLLGFFAIEALGTTIQTQETSLCDHDVSQDPPRDGVKEAVMKCQVAGVKAGD